MTLPTPEFGKYYTALVDVTFPDGHVIRCRINVDGFDASYHRSWSEAVAADRLRARSGWIRSEDGTESGDWGPGCRVRVVEVTEQR